jgi:hypothetical protein
MRQDKVLQYSAFRWAVENPSSTSNTKGYDPHVHPMPVYPLQAPNDHLDLQVVSQVYAGVGGEGVVSLSTPDDATNLIKDEVEIIENEVTVLNHTLDANLRTGYDATSAEALDTQDTNYLFESNPLWLFGYGLGYVWVQDHTGVFRFRFMIVGEI